MTDFVIREKDYDKLVENIGTIAKFCTKQEAVNQQYAQTKQKVDIIEKDYVSKSFIWKMVGGTAVILSILGTLGFRTAFLDGYLSTNESNIEIQQNMKDTIDRQSVLIEKLQDKLGIK